MEPAEALPPDEGYLDRIPNVRFVDITEKAGIHFRHTCGSFGKKLLPETLGAGVAFIDYDNDGRQDILFVNSCQWPGFEDKGRPTPTLALFRNRGDGTFEDATVQAGLAVTMYGMGVTVGDYDNDGWPDLFITAIGGNRLFHNERGHFIDVTHTAGVAGPGGWPQGGSSPFLDHKSPIAFSTSAAFLDYDGDGLLDLFVCNYVTWSPADDLAQGFQRVGLGRAFGPPKAFAGSQCLLYRNLGHGRFADVSEEAGIRVFERGQPIGKSLGVIVYDVDGDGWPDIIVANDTVRNFFFHNNGNGTFTERGIESGIAYAEGQARGAMGIDAGEYRPDLTAVIIANFANEPDTLLRLSNSKKLLFSDVALPEGIAGPSRSSLKFGTFFFDYDLDGRLDIFTCNGHLEPEIGQVQSGQSYRQRAQLFWNSGGKSCFVPVTEQKAGQDLFRPIVGRGCAFADIDGDGDLDVVVTENGGQARLFRNDNATGNRWIRLELEGDGRHSNKSAIGARIEVKVGSSTQRRQVVSGRGYLSQSELPQTIGLGKADKVDQVTIWWPGKYAAKQVLRNVAVDKVYHIRQEQNQ